MQLEAENRIVKGIDLVIDFATLGEYRVVTDAVRKPVDSRDIWATDIEWSNVEWAQSARSREIECSLPRARDRKLARERVRG